MIFTMKIYGFYYPMQNLLKIFPKRYDCYLIKILPNI